MSKRILRPAEAQARLGVRKSQFWDWIKAGRLKAPVRLGPKSVGHPENEIDEFIDQLVAERDAAVKPKAAAR